MDEFLGKILSWLALPVIGLLLLTWVTTAYPNASMAVISIGVLGTIGYFAYKFARNADREQAVFDGMPVEGPMKVKLEIEQHGQGGWHYLHVDIKMTKRDWDAIRSAGLYKATLCMYPDHTAPGGQMPFGVCEIPTMKRLDFPGAQEVREAKEQIIQNLQNIRSRIEEQHTFAARPAERVEKLEI